MNYLKQSSLVNRIIICRKSYISFSCSHTATSFKIYSIFDNKISCFFIGRGEIKKEKYSIIKEKKNQYNLHDSKEGIHKNI